VALGAMGVVFAGLVGSFSFYCTLSNVERSKAVNAAFGVIGAMASFFAVCGAITAHVGIARTCGMIYITLAEFMASGRNCSNQLNMGFQEVFYIIHTRLLMARCCPKFID
jgi:hypothetical protein